MYKIELIKYPTQEDWEWCRFCTLNTVGKVPVNPATDEWKKKLIESEHSPLRELWFGIKMEIPYYVSVHFTRHNTGVNHYVQSQRNDRQNNYDRTKATQNAIVSHVMSINAQELVYIAHKRLCFQASKETRQIMKEICNQIIEKLPEFNSVLVPLCEYRNGLCTEFNCCGYNKKLKEKTNENSY